MPKKIKTHNPFPSTFGQSPDRKADKAFYKSRLWRENRRLFLQEHQLCIECEREGRLVAAEVVDHIIPRKQYNGSPVDWENLQAMCRTHHSLKTADEMKKRNQSPSGGIEKKGCR